ncbi:sulfite exporter TauE/SafE family protein [Francisella philomiragia]|uniref:sulfite exporter TauE/SafE family protein n=1 Tax=Francisella philomiragia TaxID=28110 RepID=UPI001907C46A|nr:sulfite exporter TauE/SafE family protein [Francisella philomiragia]MBK2092461.1 sulfite exporter TauE/SafE family protein [Francisella philomiragia]MBK2257233.1 sulfite exporter TauE/SafE family protein [Francisella philomiragia]MBK2269890.1 sulfite exporter TauE/SafE family protein [Francisella philomiragia]MBK2271764.1 sulfite exporter TauE/SafE family protein [Francisella philomiragia]MBK2275609.1 sulfite exporter TauE/SafE family protein [Francisella philomiragia]
MLIILGAIVGFVASFISTLLGGGAGLIAVPAFYFIIVHTYGADFAMQIAIATCCGMSIFLSSIATYKHYRKGNIHLGELKYYLVYLSIGALVGSIVAKHINTDLLKIVFAILLFGSGIWMILHNDNKVVKLPRSVRYSIFSFCGVLSVLASSTTFATMFFIKIGTDIKKAIAITSICVLINSSIAAFVLTYGISVNVPSTLGYLNIPLLVSSGIFALAGSLLAVNYLGIISPKLLKNLFIVLMFVSGGVMII